MLRLNLCLFLCLEACNGDNQTAYVWSCDSGVVAYTQSQRVFFHEIENFLFHFRKSNALSHVWAVSRDRVAQTKVHREIVRQSTVYPKRNETLSGVYHHQTSACWSSRSCSTQQFCFDNVFLLSPSLRSPCTPEFPSMRAFAETPIDMCLVRRKFSCRMTIYGRSHASKYIKPQWHTKQIDFNCSPFTVLFRCRSAAAAAAAKWIGIDLADSVDFFFFFFSYHILSSATTIVQLFSLLFANKQLLWTAMRSTRAREILRRSGRCCADCTVHFFGLKRRNEL